ncbi:MAG: PspC domain-containing protein [Ilumatobacteraceae bacterium]
MDEQTALMDTAPEPDDQADDQTSSLPPPTGAAAHSPWYRVAVARDRDNSVLGGVVSGVSRAYGFDVRTTRIAVAIATLVLPVIALIYIIAWVLLPDTPATAQPLDAIVRDRRRFPLYVALAIVLVAAGLGSIGSWFVFGSFPWGIGLIAIGVLLWAAPNLRRSRDAAVPAAPVSTVVPVPPVTAVSPVVSPVVLPVDQARGPHASAQLMDDPTMAMPVGETAHGRDRRRRIPIVAVTLVALFVGVAIASIGDALDWWDTSVFGALVLSAVALATAAAVSAIVNRRWWLVPIAVIAGLVASMLLVAQPNLDHGAGTRTVRPVTTSAVVERLGVGDLVIDLRDVPLTAGDWMPVTAELGVGHLRILVPDDAQLEIRSSVNAGVILVDHREIASGMRTTIEQTVAAVTSPTMGTIVLDLSVGAGQIDVDYGPRPA